MLASNLLQYNYGTKRFLTRDFLPSDLPSSPASYEGLQTDLFIQDLLVSERLDNSDDYFLNDNWKVQDGMIVPRTTVKVPLNK